MRLDRFITLHVVRPLFGSHHTDRQSQPVPILMYHSISDDPEPGRSDYYKTCTSPVRFREHMQVLRDEGFFTTDLASLLASAADPPPSRRVVITFDDGFEDFSSQAWPILNEFGFTATMFLPTDFIGDERREFLGKPCLTWEEVRDLRGQGISFGSHTCSHPKLVELDQVSLQTELTRSRQIIGSELGESIETFAHPYAFPSAAADYVERFREAAGNAGYKACVTTTIGRFRSGDEPLTMRRLPVNDADDVALFSAKVSGSYDWCACPQAIMKSTKRKRTRLRAQN